MYADEIAAADDVTAKINEKASEYAALQSSIEQAAARGYVDTIINPEDTRKYIIASAVILEESFLSRYVIISLAQSTR